MIRIPARTILVLFVCLAAVLGTAYGQRTYGTIIGTVTDSTGAAIPGATVLITDEARGIELKTSTNETGNYIQSQLLSGTYRVTIQSEGFKTLVQQNVSVEVDRETRVDRAMSVGEVTESITVEDTPPLLVTDRGEVSTTMQSEQVNELPLLNRNLISMQMLMPGATKMQWQHADTENPQGSIQINNNGQEFGSTGFLVDGVDNFDPVLGIAIINPSVDSVSEYKSSSGNYDAEYAQGGGAIIQVTSKSGTNAFHGSAFWFLQNDNLDAADPFSQADGVVPERTWNQFGGSVGGPIVRNKVFFFGDAQLTRRRTGGSGIVTVPTALQRSGNFSEFDRPIFDPTTGDATGSGRTPFSNNVIPQSRFSSQALNLLDFVPLPNREGLNANYTAAGSAKFDSAQYAAKVDHYLTENVRYFARYVLSDNDQTNVPSFGPRGGGPSLSFGTGGISDSLNHNLSAGATYTMSPSFLTDIRFGFSRYKVSVLPLDYGENTATEIGIPGLNFDDRIDTSGIPAFFIEGQSAWRAGYSLGQNCNCPLRQRENVYQLVNKWTKLAGNHSWKWGVEFQHARNIRIASDATRHGRYWFEDPVTGTAELAGSSGIGTASFLLGLPSQFGRIWQNDPVDPQDAQNRLRFFLQDKWRVTPKLTLSLGVRWDTWFPNYSVNEGQGSQYNVVTNEIIVAGVGGNSRSANFETQWGNISPRIGIAYQINDKTVIRTGFGRSYYQEIFGATFNNTAGAFPTNTGQTLTSTGTFVPLPITLADAPPPVEPPVVPDSGRLQLEPGVGAGYRPVDLAYSYVDSWNFTFERALARDLVWNVGYVGNIGRNLRQGLPLNLAIPGPGPLNPRRVLFNKFGLTQGISDNNNKGSNNYHSLQTKLTKRFSDHYTFLITYTYQKVINNSQQYVIANFLNRAPADYDRTHGFTTAFTAELPFGTSSTGAVNHIIGGWRVTGMIVAQSGRPFSPGLADTSSLNADGGTRPDATGTSPIPGEQTRDQWFIGGVGPGDPWAIPGPYLYGSAGRNSLRGPGLFNADLAVHKEFAITETKELTFRWEFLNAFNTTNMEVPSSSVDTSNAGRITSLLAGYPMRRMQVGLRFDF